MNPRVRRTPSVETVSPSGSSRPRDTGLLRSSCSSRPRTAVGILASVVVEEHVPPEMRIAAEDLVGAFARQHDFVAGVAHRAREDELGDAVGVEAKRLRVPGRVREVVGEVVLTDRHRVVLGPGSAGHLPRDHALVVVRPVEGQREGPDRAGQVLRGEADHRAGVQPAAEVAADRNVGPQPQAHRLVEAPRNRSAFSASLPALAAVVGRAGSRSPSSDGVGCAPRVASR